MNQKEKLKKVVKYILGAVFLMLITFSCRTSKTGYELHSNIYDGKTYSTVLILEEESYEVRKIIQAIHSNYIISVETEKSGILLTNKDTLTLLDNKNKEMIESYYFGDATRNYLYKYSKMIDSTGKELGFIEGLQINKLDEKELKAILQRRKKCQNAL